jgi:MFS family permease
MSAKRRTGVGLDLVNVFIADLQTGLGPFLAIYLTSARGWDAATVGVIVAAQSIVSVLVTTPIGAFVDWAPFKKWLMVGGAQLIAVGCVALFLLQTPALEIGAQAVIGTAAALFGTAVTAVSLGVVGTERLPVRAGRNEAMYNVGNVGFALTVGVMSARFGHPTVFFLAAGACLASSVVGATFIRARDVDDHVARGDPGHSDTGRIPIRALFRRGPVIAFLVAMVLLHFGNGAMLPLVGEILGAETRTAAPYMSACIIVAQLTMIPVAIGVGRLANSWGRKPLFLFSFAMVALRPILFSFAKAPMVFVALQVIDGLGAGTFGVLCTVLAADLARGTGHFNTLQGAIGAAVGVGVFLSNVALGFIVRAVGYHAGFLVLATGGALAALVYALFVPETHPHKPQKPSWLLAPAHQV